MPISPFAIWQTMLSSFRGHFTSPTFERFVLLAVGWVLAANPSPRESVAQALQAAGISGQLHWAAFHRFFTRASWTVDRLGQTLLRLLLPLVSDSWFELAIDDTVAQKRGAHVFGAWMHIDAVRSTAKRRNLVRGHCWVVLGLVLDVPWSSRPWFVPLLFRLYRGKREAGNAYRTKPQLAREMLDIVLTWVKERPVRLMLDSGYMNKAMLSGLPIDRLCITGSLKTNAALYRPLPPSGHRAAGRPRKRGERLPAPSRLQHDGRRRWVDMSPNTRGEGHRSFLTFEAQWYHVLGARTCRIVLLREHSSKLRVVLCTDPTCGAEAILAQGKRRWPIEVWNRDVKQLLGFADSPAWSPMAVLRTAPWVGLLSGILVLWFSQVWQQGTRLPPLPRPWYATKVNVTFADVLRLAQHTLRQPASRVWLDELVHAHKSRLPTPTGGFSTVPGAPIEVEEMAKAA